MPKTHLVILASVALSAVLGAAGTYYIMDMKQSSESNIAVISKSEPKQKTEAEIKKDAELQALFNIYLNNFQDDLKKQAELYKNTKQIMMELAQPYNFDDPKMAKENYRLFKDDIAPSLRRKSNDIVAIFEKYNNTLAQDIKSETDELQLSFLTQWKDMSNEKLVDLIRFLTSDEELIKTYQELIKFYYVHSGTFEVSDKGELKFKYTKDKVEHTRLRNKINALKNAQKDALKKEKPSPASSEK